MQMAISAVITNANEAVEKGGHIRIGWKKRTAQTPFFEGLNEEPTGDYIVLEINDNGHGMDEITKQRIFEPFFSTKFPGRGLSLAAVYGIVTNHHGAISVESEIEKGTTVYIGLPLAKK
jgi:signal transduction histidine kinase